MSHLHQLLFSLQTRLQLSYGALSLLLVPLSLLLAFSKLLLPLLQDKSSVLQSHLQLLSITHKNSTSLVSSSKDDKKQNE